MTIIPLPHETRQAFGIGLGRCRNLGLRLDKYPEWSVENGLWQSGGDEKRRWFETLANIPSADGDLIRAVVGRTRRLLAEGVSFELRTETSLVVGLGGNTVVETGLTCHPLYGFPYVPGSTLKGLARAVALIELAGHLNVPLAQISPEVIDPPPDPKPITPLAHLDAILVADWPEPTKLGQALSTLNESIPAPGALVTLDPVAFLALPPVVLFRTVFGYLGNAGTVNFLDAIPTEPPGLVVDIMNPHYAEYYMDDTNTVAPTDNQRLTPIAFLAVAKESKFLFAITPRSAEGRGDPLARAEAWLRRGLTEAGIGGKTSSGYGLFAQLRSNLV